MVSTRPSDETDWLLRPAENEDVEPHRVRFVRWVASGERDDYAEVAIEPPMQPPESGVPDTLSEVVLAPRHSGISLRSVSTYPVDVYVLTAPPEAMQENTIPPDAFKIRFWGLLESAGTGRPRR
jgi:hypothetical protein